MALQKLLLKWLDVKEYVNEELDELRIEYQSLVKPRNFVGADAFETIYIREFEDVCHSLQAFTKRNIKEMNVVEYYSLIDYAEEKAKNNKGLSILSLLGLG